MEEKEDKKTEENKIVYHHYDGSEKQFYNELKKNLEYELNTELDNELKKKLQDELKKELKDKLKIKLKNKLKIESDKELKTESDKELKTESDKELKTESDEELKAKNLKIEIKAHINLIEGKIYYNYAKSGDDFYIAVCDFFDEALDDYFWFCRVTNSPEVLSIGEKFSSSIYEDSFFTYFDDYEHQIEKGIFQNSYYYIFFQFLVSKNLRKTNLILNPKNFFLNFKVLNSYIFTELADNYVMKKKFFYEYCHIFWLQKWNTPYFFLDKGVNEKINYRNSVIEKTIWIKMFRFLPKVSKFIVIRRRKQKMKKYFYLHKFLERSIKYPKEYKGRRKKKKKRKFNEHTLNLILQSTHSVKWKFNNKLLNKKLEGKHKREKNYFVNKYFMFPFFRFLIFNKKKIKYFFNVYKLFFSIYLFVYVLNFLVIRSHRLKLLKILDVKKVVVFFKRKNYLKVDKTLKFFGLFKKKNKIFKVKVSFSSFFLLNNLNMFFFKFIFKSQNNKSINDLFFEIKKKQKNLNCVILKGVLDYRINLKILMEHIFYFFSEQEFIDYLESYFLKALLFDKINSFKFFVFLYNIFYNLLELNIDDVILKKKIIKLRHCRDDLFFDILTEKQEEKDKKIFRFFNIFYLVLDINVDKDKFLSKLLKFFLLNLRVKPISLKFVVNEFEFISLKSFLKINNQNKFFNFFNFNFIFEFLIELGILSKENEILANKFLLNLSIEKIYNFYYKIYLIILGNYCDFLNLNNFKEFYFILRRSCFLTISLKLKSLNINIELKEFTKKQFFFFNKYTKLSNLFKYDNSDILDSLSKVNILNENLLLKSVSIVPMKRKHEIKFFDHFALTEFIELARLLRILTKPKKRLREKRITMHQGNINLILKKKTFIDGMVLNWTLNFVRQENIFFLLYSKLNFVFLDFINLNVFLERWYFTFLFISNIERRVNWFESGVSRSKMSYFKLKLRRVKFELTFDDNEDDDTVYDFYSYLGFFDSKENYHYNSVYDSDGSYSQEYFRAVYTEFEWGYESSDYKKPDGTYYSDDIPSFDPDSFLYYGFDDGDNVDLYNLYLNQAMNDDQDITGYSDIEVDNSIDDTYTRNYEDR